MQEPVLSVAEACGASKLSYKRLKIQHQASEQTKFQVLKGVLHCLSFLKFSLNSSQEETHLEDGVIVTGMHFLLM